MLFLAPDLTMLGYLQGKRLGAAIYNTGHTYWAAAIPGLLGLAMHAPLGEALALIWAAHIGFDRLLGFGLKYATGFKDTHLTH